MKIKILALVLLLGFGSRGLSSTNITLVTGNTTNVTTFNLSTGQVVQVLHLNGSLQIGIAGQNFYYGYNSALFPAPNAPLLPVVAGPATLIVGQSSFCTIQLTGPADSFIPSNAVVIPNDNGGPVTIILESSVDLINWTPALPGTYGTTSSKRFFRVRAQR
jgi:hypothetical protein